MPKATDLSSDDLLEARTKAIADVSLAYSLTTLQSFDAAATRATCNSSVEIKGAGGGAGRSFDVTYAISPAADSAGSLIVVADARAASAHATALFNEALQTAWAQPVLLQPVSRIYHEPASLMLPAPERQHRPASPAAAGSAHRRRNRRGRPRRHIARGFLDGIAP